MHTINILKYIFHMYIQDFSFINKAPNAIFLNSFYRAENLAYVDLSF